MRLQPTSHAAASAAQLADDFDREFREFIGSVAVSPQELAAIVTMPDYSIPQVKEYLRKGGLTGDVCCAISGSPMKRPRSSRIIEQQAPRQRPAVAAAAPLRDVSGARALRVVSSAAGSSGTALPKS